VSDDHIDQGRRDFLSGQFLFSDSLRARLREPDSRGPRPPCFPDIGKEDPCAGCDGPCVTACEPGVIRLYPGDHRLAGQPHLCFDDAGCTFCNDCVESCPQTVAEQVPSKVGTAALDSGSCIAWADVICMSCQFACTDQAISFDRNNRPAIDGDACTGCGLCVHVCPSHSIRVHS
jgi:ferredoxin-type protein NapF